MPTFEVIAEKRNMIKVRYKGIDTVGYRYKGDENPVDDSEAPAPDKDGQAAWAAQAKHAETTDRGLVQQRDEDGNFTDDYVYDPAKDVTEPDEVTEIGPEDDIIGDRIETESPARDIVRNTDFIERIFDPTENINTTSAEIERQQRYGGIPYDDYVEAVDIVLDRLESQTREVIDEYGRDTGIMWTVRYAVIGDTASITNIFHDELEYEVEVEGIRIIEDMDKRKTQMQFAESDGIELMLNEIENQDSLQNQFDNAVRDIFNAVADGSGDEIIIFQSVVEGWQYE